MVRDMNVLVVIDEASVTVTKPWLEGLLAAEQPDNENSTYTKRKT
jgi:hypothetical protein